MFPLFHLDSNREITPDELERCARLVAALRATPPSERFGAEDRWTTFDGVPAHRLAQHARAGFDPEFVRMLRLYSYIFTGWHLSDVLTGEQTPTWGVPPWATDDWPDWSIQAYYMYRDRMPAELLVSPPLVAGEVGFNVFGFCVNRDVIAYLDRIKLLQEGGIIDRLRGLARPRILEIGGGYGGLAFFLTRILPHASYTIVDLPSSLIHSGCYLTVAQATHPVVLADGTGLAPSAPTVELVPNTIADTLVGRRFDLAINTISFSEMSPTVVRGYAGLLARTLAADGQLFEQNYDIDPRVVGRGQEDNFCAPELVLAEQLRYRGYLAHANDGIWPARLWSLRAAS